MYNENEYYYESDQNYDYMQPARNNHDYMMPPKSKDEHYMPMEPEYQTMHHDKKDMELKHKVLSIVKPFVEYGMKEKKYTSLNHAMTEVSAITYLIGKGYPPHMAHNMVESWEVHEKF